MVMIDFEKAFDTVSWQFVYKTLDYFNFGPVYKTLHQLIVYITRMLCNK